MARDTTPKPSGILAHISCFESYYQKGKARKKITEKIELVRHLFRRPIEIWLILDRALYLQIHGYHVYVNQFCDKQVTPRYILIQAYKI